MTVIIKWLIVALAGSGLTKLADTYLRPLLPGSVQPEGELYPGRLLSIRTIWLLAVGVIASMAVIYLGKMLNIKILKRKI